MNFKSGDKVRRIGQPYSLRHDIGDIGLVVHASQASEWLTIKSEKENCNFDVLKEYYELVKDEPESKFDLTKESWFIRINNNNNEEYAIIQKWLFANGLSWPFGNKEIMSIASDKITNIGHASNDGAEFTYNWFEKQLAGLGEIKFNFKPKLDSVDLPETTRAREVKAVEAQIASLQEKLKTLKEQK